MNPEELYAKRMALELSQTALAKILGTTGRTVSRWETTGPVPPWVGLCIECLEWRRWWQKGTNK